MCCGVNVLRVFLLVFTHVCRPLCIHYLPPIHYCVWTTMDVHAHDAYPPPTHTPLQHPHLSITPTTSTLPGVVNRSQQDINTNKSMAESRRAEQEFFSSHPEYGDVMDRCGMGNVFECLCVCVCVFVCASACMCKGWGLCVCVYVCLHARCIVCIVCIVSIHQH